MTPREEWHLPTRTVGRRVLVYECVTSTNSLAAAFADDPARDGLAILADEQTAGRGQHGRTWTAAARSSVLLSVLLFPPPPLRRPAVLTAWAAVAVCDTVRLAAGAAARIKWPNDVLLHGKKVCGILIEQGRGTVVGIGLNVAQSDADLAAAGLPDAVSLARAVSPPPDAHAVARLLLERLDRGWSALLDGDLATLEARWKGHLGLLGRPVVAEGLDGSRAEGRLAEVSFQGLQVETVGGLLTLAPERVRHLRGAGL
jgi:BirA family biotin operon repressor/biotin-[acetyl-CoA-carboxylase] ligase